MLVAFVNRDNYYCYFLGGGGGGEGHIFLPFPRLWCIYATCSRTMNCMQNRTRRTSDASPKHKVHYRILLRLSWGMRQGGILPSPHLPPPPPPPPPSTSSRVRVSMFYATLTYEGICRVHVRVTGNIPALAILSSPYHFRAALDCFCTSSVHILSCATALQPLYSPCVCDVPVVRDVASLIALTLAAMHFSWYSLLEVGSLYPPEVVLSAIQLAIANSL